LAVQTKELHRLIANKANKISHGINIPHKKEGNDGDITIRTIKGLGVHLCVKSNGIWYFTPLDHKFNKYDDLDRVISERNPKYNGEIGNIGDEFSFKSGDTGAGKEVVLKSYGDNDISIKTGNSNTGSIKIVDGNNQDILFRPAGTGNICLFGTNTGNSTLAIPSSLAKAASATTTQVLVHENNILKYRLASEIVSDGDLNYLTNDAADMMVVSDFGANAAFKIDANQPATVSAEDSKGLWIDYDRIVAGSGTAAHNDIGIDLDVNTASLGTSSAIGMDVDVVGATSGTHTSIGLDINVSGSDNHQGLNITVPDGANDYHIKLIAADDASNDYATFSVADTGDLTIATVGDGATDSDLLLDPDGDLIISGADVKIGNTQKLYLDGGGDTYLTANGDRFYVRVGNELLSTWYKTTTTNYVDFSSTVIGFLRNEETFSDDSIIGSGDTDDTHIDFRAGQKARIELTADITTMNLIFPAVSANFTLVCNTNGDHDVTHWKVYTSDGSTAATTTDVMWPGGTKPAFTNNGTDIVSFYWDNTEKQCYGVASLAFATP